MLWHRGPILVSRYLKVTGRCSTPGPFLKKPLSGSWSMVKEGNDVHQRSSPRGYSAGHEATRLPAARWVEQCRSDRLYHRGKSLTFPGPSALSLSLVDPCKR